MTGPYGEADGDGERGYAARCILCTGQIVVEDGTRSDGSIFTGITCLACSARWWTEGG